MKKLLKFLLKPFWGKKFFQPLFQLLFLFSIKGLNIGSGSTWSESGEEWVIKYFARLAAAEKEEVVFFDVGANKGAYALAVEAILKTNKIAAKIYSFEPSKKTFEMLRSKVLGHSGIEALNIALGKEPSEAKLFSNEEGSGLASLYKRNLDFLGIDMAAQETVRVESLENFCLARNIAKIDFLKLDVEGHELQVLLGAGEMLKQGAIKFIQFEFGGADIDSKTFFKDFFNLLAPDYDLYRILQNGLYRIEKYRETDEIFTTTNYLAILKRQPFI